MPKDKYRKVFFEKELNNLREKIILNHKKCGGTGFTEKLVKDESPIIKRKIVVPCSCRKKYEKLSKFMISNVPYDILVNQHIYGKLVTDSISSEVIELRKEIVYPYIKKIKEVANNPYGLVFLGKNGTGKTFVGLKILYYAIINELEVFNIDMSGLLELSRKSFDRNSSAGNLLDEISSVDFLMIDEVGNESKRSSYSVSEFKNLLKKRVTLRKPTILVSNFLYKDFKKEYGKSIDSIVAAHFKILDFSKAADVRKTKCRGEMDLFFKKIKRK